MTLIRAFTIGTPDAVSHLAEELPRPRRDLPVAVAVQMTFGTICTHYQDPPLHGGQTDMFEQQRPLSTLLHCSTQSLTWTLY